MNRDEYMELLEQRRAAWEAAHPAREAAEAQIAQIKRDFPGSKPQLKPKWTPLQPLLEWFIEPGDEDLVTFPEPEPKPKPRPRVYRSAASLREEREEVQAQIEALWEDDGDMAVVNLSPHAKSPAARNAGRRRMANLDREIDLGLRLSRRLQSLDARIAAAEAREQESNEQEGPSA